MTFKEIRAMPTTCDKDGNIHESVMRSFHALRKIMELVRAGTPPGVIVEIHDDMMNYDPKNGADKWINSAEAFPPREHS